MLGLTKTSEYNAMRDNRDEVLDTLKDCRKQVDLLANEVKTAKGESDYRDRCIKNLVENLQQLRTEALEQSELAVTHQLCEANQKLQITNLQRTIDGMYCAYGSVLKERDEATDTIQAYQTDCDKLRETNEVLQHLLTTERVEHLKTNDLKGTWLKREQTLVAALELRTSWQQASIKREIVLDERLDELHLIHGKVLKERDDLTAKFNFIKDTLQTVIDNE